MTMSTAASSGASGPSDEAVPEHLLARAEGLVMAMQRGVDEQAWEGLPALADQLHGSLAALEHVARDVSANHPGRRATMVARLNQVAERHAAVLEALTIARDQTATELALALQGHSAAGHYLNAAGGS
ncbi:MAG: hypothetical protein JJU27_00160 [Gammaproteobacteria bacterium]|nr:hypothetical protein [Gammaproteobacteria bacterium]